MTLNGATLISGRKKYVPPQTEAMLHDVAGNRTRDGRWEMRWDNENRLIDVQTSADAITAGLPNQRLRYTYDADGRLIERRRFSWVAGAWLLEETTRYLNDGLQCVAEFNASNGLLRRQVWGLDLDGSRGGLGGIGGLLWIVSTTNGTHYAAPDGSGNVVALFGTGGAETARYEYGPFGELLRMSGTPIAAENPWRFSSKRQDPTTDWVHYEFRVYDPSSGRWLSRDPIGEAGGENLYGFVGNDPVNQVDLFGLECSGAMCGGDGGWLSPARAWTTQKDQLQAKIDASDSLMAVAGQLGLELADVAITNGNPVIAFDGLRVRTYDLYCQGGIMAVAEDAYAQLEEMVGTADWVRVADFEDQYTVWERTWYGVQASAKTYLAVIGAVRGGSGKPRTQPAAPPAKPGPPPTPNPPGTPPGTPTSCCQTPASSPKVCGPDAPRPPAGVKPQCSSAAGTPLAAAEAELGADLVSLAKAKRKPAVVVGAVDPATGRAVAGRSFKGYCAEREAADMLGVSDKAIQFTKPVRPRTGEVIPVCKKCQKRFDRSQFPEGTPFEE